MKIAMNKEGILLIYSRITGILIGCNGKFTIVNWYESYYPVSTHHSIIYNIHGQYHYMYMRCSMHWSNQPPDKPTSYLYQTFKVSQSILFHMAQRITIQLEE